MKEKNHPRGHKSTIVAMTAGVLSGEKSRALAAGMDDFLAKVVLVKLIWTGLVGLIDFFKAGGDEGLKSRSGSICSARESTF